MTNEYNAIIFLILFSFELMCGIIGLLDYNNNLSERKKVQLVKKGLAFLKHRGPNDKGVWISEDKKCVLGHHRLSIMDLSSKGHQPMLSASRQLCLSYNGELYNSEEIIKLTSTKHYRSNSDTEILLEAYDELGDQLFDHIDAMYALGLYHQPTQTLTIARDCFGEKPLYYFKTKDFFAFSSELSALSALSEYSFQINQEALSEYLLFQYIQSPRTIFKNVYKLEPGTYLKVQSSNCVQKRRYFRYQPRKIKFNATKEDLLDELEHLLTESLSKRLRCDTDYGSFLSGGIDSTLIAVLSQKKLNINLKTFSLGFHDFTDSEHEQAYQTAKYLKTQHHQILIKKEKLKQVEFIAKLLDEPNADTSLLPCYYLSEFAAKKVKVALSGDGGDELFGGYKRYAIMALLEKRATSQFPNNWNLGQAYFSDHYFIFSQDEVSRLTDVHLSYLDQYITQQQEDLNLYSQNIFDSLRKKDIETYLPGAVLAKMDRASMLNSLEVRAPFLSKKLAEFSMSLPQHFLYQNGELKYLLRSLLFRLAPNLKLIYKKRGFGIPAEEWSEKSFLHFAQKSLLSSESTLKDFLNQTELENIFNGSNLKAPLLYKIWSILILEFWLRANINKTISRNTYDAITI